jgi:protein gp37
MGIGEETAMGENSKIEWCHHTFNPWIGCAKLSDACDNCYAEKERAVTCLGVKWGAGEARHRTAASTWKQPLAWNRRAAKEGRRARVFCASLGDVFDAEVSDDWRDDLFALIAATPHLDWLLLTKRPKVMRDYADGAFRCGEHWLAHKDAPPVQWPLPNVWLGTTVENQAMADLRIPLLLETPAAVRFLSMEPLLGYVDLTDIHANGATFREKRSLVIPAFLNALTGMLCRRDGNWPDGPKINWVITGGESGPNARPTHPDWFRSVRDQCAAAGVPFLFKQWGEYLPAGQRNGITLGTDADGRDIDIGTALRSGQAVAMDDLWTYRIGKKAAGRHLDGVIWDQVPEVA